MQTDRLGSKIFSSAAASLLGASLFASAFIFAGCSHSSSGPPAENLSWVVPGISSDYVETTSHGTLALGKQGSTSASYFVISAGSFAGKSNTITLVNYINSSDVKYFAFESNGDYSLLDSTSGFAPADWHELPTGGGQPITQSSDTTYAPDGVHFLDTTHVNKDFTRTYLGVENITDVDTITYAAYKIHEVTIEDDSVIMFQHQTAHTITTSNTYYWIAPSIGWIVKDSTCDGTNWKSKLLNGCTVK